MQDYPLLPIPTPEKEPIPSHPGGSSGRILPLKPAQQERRLGPVFRRLRDALAPGRNPLTLRDDPTGIAPERAIVMEVGDSIDGFRAALRKIPGLEYLGEEETEYQLDDDFAIQDKRKGRDGQLRRDLRVGGRLYFAMPDLRALRELLSLWDRFQSGEKAERGFTPWLRLFECLRAVRAWGPMDRIPEETIEYWQDVLEDSANFERIRAEIELWNSGNQLFNQRAERSFKIAVQESEATVISRSVIAEIGYEGVLIDLPREEAIKLIQHEEVRLAICDGVMYIRPQITPSFPKDIEVLEEDTSPVMEPPPKLSPIAAIFDGMPVQRHSLLDGRLIIDDPDDIDRLSVIDQRHHGTAMASLVLHGDRNLSQASLPRQVYFRPVLYAPGNGEEERPIEDRLLIDTIYRAVVRMKDGDESGDATSPSVFIVNLSLGDRNHPFTGPMSPWGRLIDYLSDRYQILFIISAGNIPFPLPVPKFTGLFAFEDAVASQREDAVFEALRNESSQRTLLSPGEALNSITVGACYEDAVNQTRDLGLAVTPYENGPAPNISSALGLGHRKTIKPDILMPGGRELVTMRSGGEVLQVIPSSPGRSYGVRAAVTDTRGSLRKEGLTSGTSAATALASRAAHRLFDALNDDGTLVDMDPDYYGVVVKALLVHRAKWGDKGARLDELYGPHGTGSHTARRDNIARVFGYGRPVIEEALHCGSNRATMIGYGDVTPDRMYRLYRVPLPTSLDRNPILRTITLTIGWFSPVNFRHRDYRRAKLEILPDKLEEKVGAKRVAYQPASTSVARGSLFHVCYSGCNGVSFVDGGHLVFRVVCRERGGSLDQSIRYGLAVTIESDEGIPVYQEVRQRLAVRPRPAVLA